MEAAVVETIEYDVVAGNYGEFIEDLRKVLAEYHPAGDQRTVVDYRHAAHPVLPQQRSPHRPARWIQITLLVRDEGHETTLAVRDDNVYLIGFRNRRRQWYEFGFSGCGGGGRRSARMLPEQWNSTFLECDVGYGGIVGGAMNLVGHRLGRVFAREAVRRLSAYDQAAPGGGGADELTRLHLARLIVMVCEAARMIPHCETVLHGWDQTTGGALDARQVHMLWNWKLMSHAVLLWDQWRNRLQPRSYVPEPPTWPPALRDPEVGVRNVGEALEIVQLLLNFSGSRALSSSSQPPPPQETSVDAAADGDTILQYYWHDAPVGDGRGQQGQCMLQMFGMRAGFYMRGTISVFDGMRGQVIYSNDDKPDDDDDLGRINGPRRYSLDHGDVGDRDTHHGRPFGEWMFAHLRSIYDWAGLSWNWNRRSQLKTIASKRENGSTLGQGHNLVLTGPYRAISAYGSVSIEIDSTTTETDSNFQLGISTTETDYVRIDISKKDGHRGSDGRTTTTLLWDCYNDDATYDTLLTRTISTSHGPLEVTYAVLSNAVEATVQVRLLLAAEQGAAADNVRIHGGITAGCRDLDAQSLLFCQGEEEKVAVTRDSHVPLSRSVVAVPLTSELLITAALHTSVVASSSNHTAAEGLLPEPPLVASFRPEPSGQEVQRFGIDGGHFEIKVIWALDI